MPNIEIHGSLAECSKMLREMLFNQLFVGTPYIGEMVVTIVPSEVTDAKGSQQPFFRLFSPDPKEAEGILEILERNVPGIDVEYIRIEKFVPKKK